MSALQYALDVLGVESVIVCGHDACGGVRVALLPPSDSEAGAMAAPGRARSDFLAERIRPLRRLYQQHRHQVDDSGSGLPVDEALDDFMDHARERHIEVALRSRPPVAEVPAARLSAAAMRAL